MSCAGTVDLAQAILQCRVRWVDDPTDLEQIVAERGRFAGAGRQVLDARVLVDVARSLAPNVVHEVEDSLGAVVVLARTGTRILVVGPYTRRALGAVEAGRLLGRLRIPSTHLHAYQLFRSTLSIVDSEYAVRTATALVAGPNGQHLVGYTKVDIDSDGEPGAVEAPQSATYEVIEERYAAQDEFMVAVTDGDEHRALAALGRLQRVGQPAHGGYLDNPFLGPTMMRVMTRLAAEAGGLPPVTVDAISQTYAQRLHRRGHTPGAAETAQEIVAMVRDFCTSVRRHRQHPYSRVVRQVVDEIELHVSHNVSTHQIADRLGISASHLARVFKAETGHSISEHVARVRVARGSELLAATTLPVRDVAAYVGYGDANYFTKVFRARTGLTPTAFRASRASPTSR